MPRDFAPVRVHNLPNQAPYDVTVDHGTAADGRIVAVACGPFTHGIHPPHPLPTLGTRYALTLTEGHVQLPINMYCTFSGDTSEFNLNPRK